MNNFKKPFHRGASAGSRPFSRGSHRPFGGASGGYRSARPGPNEEREMFSATCNKCREACEVPFRPNGKKPVYCRNCFVRDEVQAANSGSYGRPSSSEDYRISAIQKEISAINAKLDDLIARLEG